MRELFLACCVMIFGRVAFAESFTATCEEENGYSIFMQNGRIHQKGEDAISGSRPTYSWNMSTKRATVVMQHTSQMGGTPQSYEAVVIPVSNNQISFLIIHKQGIEIHSIFLDTGTLFVSMHKDFGNFSKGDASGKVFSSRCKIGTN